jgi:transcriptional regulator with XRE-family HTH domain
MDAMRFGIKLQRLRKEQGLSQETLAETLGVSRQAVSKWESGQSWPETDKLIALSELFGTSLDSLVKDTEGRPDSGASPGVVGGWDPRYQGFSYEYKSKRTLFGLPLVHVNIGYGRRRAKGIFAVSSGVATGFVALGLVSIGLVSLGIVGLGLLAFGVTAAGLLLAAGVTAVGTVAVGAVASGVFALGAVAAGVYAVGAVAGGLHFAIGDHASGIVAVGKTAADGARAFLAETPAHNWRFPGVDPAAVADALRGHFPDMPDWFVRFLTGFVNP